MITPMQIAFIVVIVFGFLQVISSKYSDTIMEMQGQQVQGGTLFWISLLFLAMSVLIRVFG